MSFVIEDEVMFQQCDGNMINHIMMKKEGLDDQIVKKTPCMVKKEGLDRTNLAGI